MSSRRDFARSSKGTAHHLLRTGSPPRREKDGRIREWLGLDSEGGRSITGGRRDPTNHNPGVSQMSSQVSPQSSDYADSDDEKSKDSWWQPPVYDQPSVNSTAATATFEERNAHPAGTEFSEPNDRPFEPLVDALYSKPESAANLTPVEGYSVRKPSLASILQGPSPYGPVSGKYPPPMLKIRTSALLEEGVNTRYYRSSNMPNLCRPQAGYSDRVTARSYASPELPQTDTLNISDLYSHDAPRESTACYSSRRPESPSQATYYDCSGYSAEAAGAPLRFPRLARSGFVNTTARQSSARYRPYRPSQQCTGITFFGCETSTLQLPNGFEREMTYSSSQTRLTHIYSFS